MDSREKILSKINEALKYKTQKNVAKPNFQADIYLDNNEDLTVFFAENFSKNGGELFYCPSLEDFLGNLKAWLEEEDISGQDILVRNSYLQDLLDLITLQYHTKEEDLPKYKVEMSLCEALIARTGSVLLSSDQKSKNYSNTPSSTHIVLGFTSQIFKHIKNSLTWLKENRKDDFPAFLSFVSGLSKTNDIESKFVSGMYGSEKLVLFLVEDIQELV